VRLSIDQNTSEPETLVDQIERACGLHSRLHDPELQSIVSGIRDPATLTSAAIEALSKTLIAGFTLDDYFEHAQKVGRLAEAIASVMTDFDHRNFDGDDAIALTKYALVAGTLHDIGKLVLAIHKADEFREALSLAESTQRPLWQAEMAVIGTTHAAIGAHLFCSWGYPRSMVDALALHHQPSLHSSRDCTVLMAVHVANAIERPAEDPTTIGQSSLTPSWDEDFLDELGLLDRVRQWELRHRHSR
jgi:HD-like signal output (HDOD) protein